VLHGAEFCHRRGTNLPTAVTAQTALKQTVLNSTGPLKAKRVTALPVTEVIGTAMQGTVLIVQEPSRVHRTRQVVEHPPNNHLAFD